MRFKQLAMPLAMSLTLAAPTVFAGIQQPGAPEVFNLGEQLDWAQADGLLSEHARRNKDLIAGDYLFGAFHEAGKKQSGFFDEWSFTLADSGNVTINLFDLNIADATTLLPSTNLFAKLLDTKLLTVSLFDQEGSLLGTAGENGTLSALGLTGGEWYTLAVSGKAAGLLGGLYYGSMDVAAVPLSDTLPLFASALALTAFRLRKAEKAEEKAAA